MTPEYCGNGRSIWPIVPEKPVYGSADAGHDRLRGGDVGRRRLLRQQVAEHEEARIELIRVEPAPAAAEEVAAAAGVGRAERHGRASVYCSPAFQF